MIINSLVICECLANLLVLIKRGSVIHHQFCNTFPFASMSLIDALWAPIIKTQQLLGNFPLEKCKDNTFIAMKTCKFLLVHFSVGLFASIALHAPMILLGWNQVVKVFWYFEKDDIDVGSWIMGNIAVHLLHVLLTWQFIKVKQKMGCILNHMRQQTKLQQAIGSRRRTLMILYLMFLGISSLLSTSGYLLLLNEEIRTQKLADDQRRKFGLSLMGPLIIIYWIWLYGPVQVTLILFSDICLGLQSWAETLKKTHHRTNIAKHVLDFKRKGLQEINGVFSSILFYIICFNLILLVVNSYGSISYCGCVLNGLQKDDKQMLNVLIISSGISSSIVLLLTLIYLNTLSHQVFEKVKELREWLLELTFETQESTNNGSSGGHLTKAIQLLKAFKGFDCCGFFVLGRPHLTSIIATFATYIIILIQFKFANGSSK